MLRRLLMLLPQDPPEWMVGFWTVYGAIFVLSLFVQSYPSDLTNQIVYWARLVLGFACWGIAAAIAYRRSHK